MKRIIGLTLVAVTVVAGTARGASVPPSAYPVVHMGVRAGDGGIYLLKGGKDSSVRASVSNGHDCGPAYSKDGRFLAFESNRLTGGDAVSDPYDPIDFEIYLIDTATKAAPKRLTFNPLGFDAVPTWSPDGRRIAFQSENPPGVNSIWVMDRDGRNKHPITTGDQRFSHVNPAWSPDGKHIAYQIDDTARIGSDLDGDLEPDYPAIHVMNPSGTGDRLIQKNAMAPAWSPNGSQIVFSSARGVPRVDVDNPSPPSAASCVALAGDPRSLVDQDLYVMDASGARAHLLKALPGADLLPSWSPDGRHITYANDPDGFIYYMPIMTPTGAGLEPVVGGPAPAQIMELTLSSTGKVVGAPRQLTNATEMQMYPKYAPVLNPAY
jgi:Tol biopolymer transport system component